MAFGLHGLARVTVASEENQADDDVSTDPLNLK